MDWSNPAVVKKYKAVETMTGPFALHLIKQCGLDCADGSENIVILDNACGTGIVTAHLYETVPSAARAKLQVICGDFSPAMVQSVQARITQSGWEGANAKVVDAQAMDLPSDTFTHVLTNFAIVGVPDPRACLADTFRVLQPAGTAALTIWKYVGWYPIAVAAVASIPNVRPLPTFEGFSTSFLMTPGDDKWVEPAFFKEQIRKAGFEDVKTVLHSNVTRYKNAEEWMETFGSITKSVVNTCLNEEERDKVEPHLEAEMLKELKRKFGDGEVVLTWEAWGVTAKAAKSG